jgi:hypothetical protein
MGRKWLPPVFLPTCALNIDFRYDGNAIGTFIPDQFQEHGHIMYGAGLNVAQGGAGGGNPTANTGSNNTLINQDSIRDPSTANGLFPTTRTGPSTNPASVSAYLCIKY